MATSRIRKSLKENYKTVVCGTNYEEAFMKQCIEWLKNVNAVTCFKVLPFDDIKNGYLREAKKETKHVQFDELESALKNMEKYAHNLLQKPWCKDFQTIKIFNGFFKYKIEKWIPLDTVCNILDSMGYKKKREGIFEIKEINEDKVLTVGLELCLAHTQLSELRSAKCLGNYSVEDILDAWNIATGNPTKIIELLHENHPTSSHEANKSGAVTTATQYQHYDKNGHPTHQVTKRPDSDDLEDLHKSSTINDMPSLSIPTPIISDDQMYGEDEANANIEDKYGHLQSRGNPSSLNDSHLQRIRYPQKYNIRSEECTSMPPCNDSKFLANKYRDDLQVHLHRQSKDSLENISLDQLYGSHFEEKPKEDNSSIHGEKHTSVETPPFVNKCSGENVVLEMKVIPGASVLLAPQNITENLDKEQEKFQKMLQARVEAGEKDLQQPKDSAETIVAATDWPNLDQQCGVCGQASVITCEKCEATACKACLKILKRKPCSKGGEHVYYTNTTKDKDSLYENVSSAQKHLEKNEDKIPYADSNKWECEHCTLLNSPETLVCDTCSHTKDVKVQNPKPGAWECSGCTFANPENVNTCQTCKMKKGNNYTSFV